MFKVPLSWLMLVIMGKQQETKIWGRTPLTSQQIENVFDDELDNVEGQHMHGAVLSQPGVLSHQERVHLEK